MSAGVSIDPEAPGSKDLSTRGLGRERDPGNGEKVAAWPKAADQRQPSASGSQGGTPPREVWGVVECGCEQCCAVSNSYPQEIRLQAPERLCARGGG